MEKTYL